jgi:hypothetical protein
MRGGYAAAAGIQYAARGGVDTLSVIWTIGREREKAFALQYVKAKPQQNLVFRVIDAVCDLNEGTGSVEQFMDSAKAAFLSGRKTAWNTVDKWIRDVSRLHPEVNEIWTDLASNSKSEIRRQVAGRLYWYVSEEQSDLLFAALRHDKAQSVSSLAIERYEFRPEGRGGPLRRMFDATLFDERVRRGEVKI